MREALMQARHEAGTSAATNVDVLAARLPYQRIVHKLDKDGNKIYGPDGFVLTNEGYMEEDAVNEINEQQINHQREYLQSYHEGPGPDSVVGEILDAGSRPGPMVRKKGKSLMEIHMEEFQRQQAADKAAAALAMVAVETATEPEDRVTNPFVTFMEEEFAASSEPDDVSMDLLFMENYDGPPQNQMIRPDFRTYEIPEAELEEYDFDEYATGPLRGRTPPRNPVPPPSTSVGGTLSRMPPQEQRAMIQQAVMAASYVLPDIPLAYRIVQASVRRRLRAVKMRRGMGPISRQMFAYS